MQWFERDKSSTTCIFACDFLSIPCKWADLECYTCCALTIIIALLPWLGALRPLIEPFSQFGKSKDYLVEVAQKLRDARRKENGSTNKVHMYLCMYNVICSLWAYDMYTHLMPDVHVCIHAYITHMYKLQFWALVALGCMVQCTQSKDLVFQSRGFFNIIIS